MTSQINLKNFFMCNVFSYIYEDSGDSFILAVAVSFIFKGMED